MAFTDMCKKGAKEDIESLVKNKGISKTDAIKEIADAAGMSKRTVERIVWPGDAKYAKTGVTKKYPEISETLETITIDGKHRIEFGIGEWQKKAVLEIQEYNKNDKRSGNHFIIPLNLVPDYVEILSSGKLWDTIKAIVEEEPKE